MKCAQVKNLLADYLDKELSARDMARTKEHVSTCPECRRELEFLKSYRSYAATLKKVKAPDHLLENIHKRIESSAARNGWIKKIFFPLKTRLPIEVAGACALALIAFFIFYPFSPEKTEYRGREPQREATRAPERFKRSTDFAGQKSERTSLAKTADETRRTPVTQAPLAENRVASTESESPMRREKGPQGKATEETSEQQIAGEITIYLARKASIEAGPEFQTPDDAKMSERDAKAGAPMESSAAQSRKDKKTDWAKEYSSEKQAASEPVIEDMIRSVDGKLILKIYYKRSKYPEQMTVEIPASNLGTFIEKLKGSWIIREQVPGRLPGNLTRAKVILHFER